MLSIYGQPRRLCSGFTRREILTIEALGVGGLALPASLAEGAWQWLDEADLGALRNG